MRNNLVDLNNYLFEQLERINDDSLTEEQLDREIKKADAITAIGEQIIKNGELQFKALCKSAEYGVVNQDQVRFLLTNKGTQNEKV